VEPSFLPSVVDRMVRVPDAGSLAAMRAASAVLGRQVGGSTGTNLWGAFGLIAGMRAAGTTGSVVTLLCDGGERYAHTYFDDGWVRAQGLDLGPHLSTVERFLTTGTWREPA
jgi:cysteine synthase A